MTTLGRSGPPREAFARVGVNSPDDPCHHVRPRGHPRGRAAAISARVRARWPGVFGRSPLSPRSSVLSPGSYTAFIHWPFQRENTPLGRAKPAALAQSAIAAGDLRGLATREGRLGVVALAGAQVVEARLVAGGLSELLAPLGEAVVVAPDLYRQRGDALRTLPEIANDLDRPGRRAELIESLARGVAQAHVTALLLPTLGLVDPVGARAELERALGLPVFEALGAPPSVPGLRLLRSLSEALEKAGVRVVGGIAEGAGGGQVQIVRGVECQPVRAGAVVLASGRFLGGGIRCEPDGRLRETVLDLPARAAGRATLAALPNEDLFAQRAGGKHPGLAAGVEVDSDLRSGSARNHPATGV